LLQTHSIGQWLAKELLAVHKPYDRCIVDAGTLGTQYFIAIGQVEVEFDLWKRYP
jgi:hypothetical protein